MVLFGGYDILKVLPELLFRRHFNRFVGLVYLAKSFETRISQVYERLHSTTSSSLSSAMQNSILYFGPTSDRQWWSVCQTPKAVGMADSNLIRFILRLARHQIMRSLCPYFN